MSIGEHLLIWLSRRVDSPMRLRDIELGSSDVESEDYNRKYVISQFNTHVKNGALVSVYGKDVLEIGCGHGGLCYFYKAAGAKRVVGIDINQENLQFAKEMKIPEEKYIDKKCDIEFLVEDGTKTSFDNNLFDIIFCNSTFEHFMYPEKILKEAYRLLKTDGILVVNPFSSIYSKYGSHVKYGVTIPWSNIFFSEKTIIKALVSLAKEDPSLKKIYPNLSSKAKRLRDIRRHGDLNDITYKKFRSMATKTGFKISYFKIHSSGYIGIIAKKLPLIKNSLLVDILSINAVAILKK